MNNTLTIAAILGAGLFVSAPLVIEGVEDIRNPAPPYMSVMPLEIDVDARTVTQTHRVNGVQNMPAGWTASISAPDGKVYCEGGSPPFGASYTNGTTNKFTWSIWTGGDCPAEMPLPLVFKASWTYQVEGQEVTITAKALAE